MTHLEHTGSRLSRVDALNEAIYRFGAPGIMNTDQGSQFTFFVWTDRLKRVDTRSSMDGKGRCIGNTFIARLWQSVSLNRSTGTLEKLDCRLKLPTVGYLIQPSTASRRPGRPAARRVLLQLHKNGSARASDNLNQPKICPRFGEWLRSESSAALVHSAVQPPSSRIELPVINEDASDSR